MNSKEICYYNNALVKVGETMRQMVYTFELVHQVGLCGLLQCLHGTGLESQFYIYLVRDFAHQPLEWQFGEKEVGGLLVAPDFPESDS
jgi:hypothetical protein